MKKDQIVVVLKTILTLVGSYLIGRKLFNTTIDESYLGLIIGSVMTVVSFVWSIVDKSLAIESLQSSIRQVIVAVGGVLIASGKLDSAKLDTYIGIILPLATYLYTLLSQKKSVQIATGKIEVTALKGVKPEIPDSQIAPEPQKQTI